MNTAERLLNYNSNFSTEVVETVAEVADWQQGLDSYQALFEAVGIAGLERVMYQGLLPVDMLDIRRKEEVPDTAIVYHLSMANPLDADHLYQIATIAKTQPNYRFIAMGRLSGFGYSGGRQSQSNRQTLARGDFGPANEPLLRYLDRERVSTTVHVGYSYGVSTAIAAAGLGDRLVTRAILIEPANVVKRSLIGLSQAFALSAKHLDEYVDATELESFKAARADSVNAANYKFGLLRATNIAIVRAIARGGFEGRLHKTLQTQPDMQTLVAWGTDSELAVNRKLKPATNRLGTLNQNRLKAMQLQGQYHALATDIHLQAAIVGEGLK